MADHTGLRRFSSKWYFFQRLRLHSAAEQRRCMGVSQMFMAMLLDVHETSLMNIESGIALPTDNMAIRMRCLGLSVELTEPSAVSELTRLEVVAFEKLKMMPKDVKALLNENITFYLAVKRQLNESADRNAVLRYIAKEFPD